MRGLATLLVAANPAAVVAALRGLQPRREIAVAGGLATVVTAVVALLSEPALDALDVTLATFQVAAAVVLGVAGVRWLVVGPWRVPEGISTSGWRRVVVPVLVPAIITPQLVAASSSVGAEHGVGTVVLGVAAAMALVWAGAVTRDRPLVWSVASRFVGLGAVVLALAMATDGIRTV